MQCKLTPEFMTKVALIKAISAGQTIIAHGDCHLKKVAIPDGQITITRNTKYPAYHSWTADIVIRNGKVIAVQ